MTVSRCMASQVALALGSIQLNYSTRCPDLVKANHTLLRCKHTRTHTRTRAARAHARPLAHTLAYSLSRAHLLYAPCLRAHVWWQTQCCGDLTGIPYNNPSDGLGYLALTAESVPASQLVTSARWPSSAEAGSATSWASLPGGAITAAFDIVNAGDKVLLIAGISRVQHQTVNKNTFFQIIIDGTLPVANSNTGNAQGWAYDAISFHGVATGLSVGSHTAELRYKASSCKHVCPICFPMC